MLDLRATTEPFESIILVSENLISLPSICSGRNIKKAFATLHMDYGVRSRLNEFDQVHRLAVKWWIIHWIIGKSYSVLAFALKKKMFRKNVVVFLLSTNKNRPHAIRTRNSKRIRFLPNAFLVWIQQSKWITVKYIIKHVWLFLITRSVPNLPAFKYFNWTNWMKKNNVDSSVVWFELVSVYIHFFLFFLFFLSSRSEETNQNQSIEIFWQIFHSNNGLNKTI